MHLEPLARAGACQDVHLRVAGEAVGVARLRAQARQVPGVQARAQLHRRVDAVTIKCYAFSNA